MNKALIISDILKYLDDENIEYSFLGNKNLYINGFSSLSQYKSNSITWIKNKRVIKKTYNGSIFLAVIQDGIKTEDITVENKIIARESKRAFFGILEHFYGEKKKQEAIGQGTYISPNVKVGNNVTIGHNCTLDGDIVIGDNTRIYNNVVIINRVKIGKNCEILSGAIIGHDGISTTEDENHVKTLVRQYGGIDIGNDVYIGGNCYVERGTIDDTVIEDGVKIDGLCIIGHNSIIKKNSMLVAGSTLLGSVQIGDKGYIASALIKNQIKIGENAFVGMGSVVNRDVAPGTVVSGVPAEKLLDDVNLLHNYIMNF